MMTLMIRISWIVLRIRRQENEEICFAASLKKAHGNERNILQFFLDFGSDEVRGNMMDSEFDGTIFTGIVGAKFYVP